MPKKTKTIHWEKPSSKPEQNPVAAFMEFCLDVYPRKDKALLSKDIASFSQAATTLSDQVEKFRKNIENIPLLSVVVFWVKNIAKDTFHSVRNAETMHQLTQHGFIGLKDTHGHVWTLSHMASLGHDPVIEAIRCNELWSIDKTEEYVQFYIGFVNWLSEATSGYIPEAIDPDIKKSIQRKIPHSDFIIILKHLKERERLMANLLYYGGDRMLDEILNLKITDIEKDRIIFKNGSVYYPQHVCKDLHNYIDGRKRGYLLVGRNGEKIDQSVPYRALKAAIAKLNLEPSFTFLDFLACM